MPYLSQRPFKAEFFGMCWDVAFSDIKIGHKMVFLHLKKMSESNLCQKKKKKRNETNTWMCLRPAEPLFL